MAKDYVMLYHQIGRLLETPPNLSTSQQCVQPAALQWFGKGHALVEAVGVGIDAIKFSTAMDGMRRTAWHSAVQEIFQILYRALGHCEFNLPPGSGGTFVPAGNSFDAFTAVTKILSKATNDVMVVDPYLDHSALTEFGLAVPEGVTLRLLADEDSYKSTLKPAAGKWIEQYGDTRPLNVRLAASRLLHDRAIFIDGQEVWTITQSLKDFAKRAHAEIVRVDSTASLKVTAYESIWAAATVLI